ncbi:hypothetical protein RN001_002744 [Aquatica leii]|uniref:Uncharacterized protein n=1 Tax=Aquatica leii TaxID=1421715 RepID=A0AAN7QNP4_9COLE|nr:hypothetical protein RN001_002744 [Aquatica leii]
MTAMCSSLQTVAGKDTIDTTKKVLRRNNKNCFADYKNILKLIMVAVRKNSFSRSATQQEIASAIIKYGIAMPMTEMGLEKQEVKTAISNYTALFYLL